MAKVIVLDKAGQSLSPCSLRKAEVLLATGRAEIVSREPFAIRLSYTVQLPARETGAAVPVGEGKRLLLHICCGPCATYSVQRLREQGYEIDGFWYNPNIHPFAEHERRRESLARYAEAVSLTVLEGPGYAMPDFFRAVAGHERLGERCAICYQLRLAETARTARQKGYEAFTTTLLISPHQDQTLIRKIGEQMTVEYGVAFHFENLRRGWAERGRLTHEHDLYRQRYCGCVYSEWESLAKGAWTARRADLG